MGTNANYGTTYQNQTEFDRFFATAFDRYDRNRDGKIDYKEYQPLVNEMCSLIQKKYGTGPTLDKIRNAWMSLDKDHSGFITRNEFSTRAKKEIERILSQAQPGFVQPGIGPHGQVQHGFAPHGMHGYGH